MAPPVPRGGGRKRRLPSIRNPSRSPSVAASPAPQLPTQPESRPLKTGAPLLSDRYSCPQCPPDEQDIQLSDDGGYVVCVNCGTEISNNPQLQNEVAFGENAQGAAIVQGTTIQEGQRRPHVQGLGYRGAQGPDAEERLRVATLTGQEEIRRLNFHLNLSPATVDRAVNLYNLAKIHAFQRPVSENAAISIYTACREVPGNTVLLIDLAEIISVNVYDLGAAYKKFLDRIDLTDKYMGSDKFQRMVEPEPLIKRFASRLEFGKDTNKVAADAASILARMNRDWMVTGRQPMGLVGACLIIAARMNNYRRTLREVVYVVRAGEMTILKRLNEFSNTPAARLTVDQFRQLRDNEALNATLKEALPPSLSKPPRKKRKILRGRDTDSLEPSSRTSSVAPSDISDATNGASEAAPRRDKDGFVIPSLPPRAQPHSENSASSPPTSSIDGHEENDEDEELRRKPGRPKKIPLPEFSVTEEDLRAEEAIEKDIAANVKAIENDEAIQEERGPGWFRAKALADAIREQERKASKWKLSELEMLNETIEEDEFEDDPEVKFCKLTEREVQVKEQIWVTHNHDWLRAQQERLLQEQLNAAKGKKKRQGPRRKMARRGDGSVLGDSPVSSAADASSKMMAARAKRHKYSRHVDYAKLQEIYGEDDQYSRAGSPSEQSDSRAGSRSAAGTPAPADHTARGTSFSPDVSNDERSPSAPPSAVTRPQDEVTENEDEEYEDEDEEGLVDTVPEFGDDDEIEEDYEEEEEDVLDIAQQYGVDMGDR
ncbi:uncharacterized protein PV09_01208 [Verruconis gallopava]|uniref:Cyclin-like domain-containing protein n=1 Tax=Verruconis gallopava TaxID=253628 RepID=A0A0D2AP15_9PEZI|nr:uncharacterized protein PV09_01208 [Verruconis gallopava]KIW08290.1 hypothetical protein PV09_01208 [Verruconis gallopava]